MTRQQQKAARFEPAGRRRRPATQWCATATATVLIAQLMLPAPVALAHKEDAHHVHTYLAVEYLKAASQNDDYIPKNFIGVPYFTQAEAADTVAWLEKLEVVAQPDKSGFGSDIGFTFLGLEPGFGNEDEVGEVDPYIIQRRGPSLALVAPNDAGGVAAAAEVFEERDADPPQGVQVPRQDDTFLDRFGRVLPPTALGYSNAHTDELTDTWIVVSEFFNRLERIAQEEETNGWGARIDNVSLSECDSWVCTVTRWGPLILLAVIDKLFDWVVEEVIEEEVLGDAPLLDDVDEDQQEEMEEWLEDLNVMLTWATPMSKESLYSTVQAQFRFLYELCDVRGVGFGDECRDLLDEAFGVPHYSHFVADLPDYRLHKPDQLGFTAMSHFMDLFSPAGLGFDDLPYSSVDWPSHSIDFRDSKAVAKDIAHGMHLGLRNDIDGYSQGEGVLFETRALDSFEGDLAQLNPEAQHGIRLVWSHEEDSDSDSVDRTIAQASRQFQAVTSWRESGHMLLRRRVGCEDAQMPGLLTTNDGMAPTHCDLTDGIEDYPRPMTLGINTPADNAALDGWSMFMTGKVPMVFDWTGRLPFMDIGRIYAGDCGLEGDCQQEIIDPAFDIALALGEIPSVRLYGLGMVAHMLGDMTLPHHLAITNGFGHAHFEAWVREYLMGAQPVYLADYTRNWSQVTFRNIQPVNSYVAGPGFEPDSEACVGLGEGDVCLSGTNKGVCHSRRRTTCDLDGDLPDGWPPSSDAVLRQACDDLEVGDTCEVKNYITFGSGVCTPLPDLFSCEMPGWDAVDHYQTNNLSHLYTDAAAAAEKLEGVMSQLASKADCKKFAMRRLATATALVTAEITQGGSANIFKAPLWEGGLFFETRSGDVEDLMREHVATERAGIHGRNASDYLDPQQLEDWRWWTPAKDADDPLYIPANGDRVAPPIYKELADQLIPHHVAALALMLVNAYRTDKAIVAKKELPTCDTAWAAVGVNQPAAKLSKVDTVKCMDDAISEGLGMGLGQQDAVIRARSLCTTGAEPSTQTQSLEEEDSAARSLYSAGRITANTYAYLTERAGRVLTGPDLPPSDSDQDGDGIPDGEDLCPAEPVYSHTPGQSVSETDPIHPDVSLLGDSGDYGCPTDADADGVPDKGDACPNTTKNADAYGCSAEDYQNLGRAI